jgi:two-component system sensor histidine kinase KdpD
MTERRPNPDELLARVTEEERRAARGKLTIFFGAAPGVGKTYAMLEAARFEREDGRDMVVGIVETHGRYDTGALLPGLEILPRKKLSHKGIALEELDLDAALLRSPNLILIDELAHTNAPGCRHAKRWQDVEELLAAGIDVYTTLNVQHLESLNDVVAQITHVVVRETVPDRVFEEADDVRLIDLPIDELLQRLKEGRVYVPEQARVAGESFFREGNLIALREIALRLTAQRVDAQMRRYRAEHGIERTWPAAERIVVCVSPSPASEKLVRAARRLAASLHGEWIATYVETTASLRLSGAARARVAEHMRLAQSLGAETVTLGGDNAPRAIVEFARSRNVTRILVGKPTHSPWRDRIRQSFLDELVRLSGDIDVHVLTGDEQESTARPRSGSARARKIEWSGYLAAPLVIGAGTAFARSVFGVRELADVVMIYLLGIVLVSIRWGLGPSLVAAVLGVFSYDFFFVPPFYTFAVADMRHVVTFVGMFVVGGIISGLTRRVRDQAEAARVREMRTASLYSLSRSLASAKATQEILVEGTKHLHAVFSVSSAALLSQGAGLRPALEGPFSFPVDEKDRAVADWVWQHGRPAGLTTDTLPSASALFVPLTTPEARVGVLGIRPDDRSVLEDHEQRQHLDAFIGQIANALARARLAEQAQAAQIRIEAEQLRNSLLSSVSHDLRTPLAVITGTASTLLDTRLEPGLRTELTETILTEAERLNRLVRNLLDMTRLEAGAVVVHKEWQPLEEAVGAALERVQRTMGTRIVTTKIAPEASLAPYDSILLQQVLVNLLENAAKYTPETSAIDIGARRVGSEVEITVADHGPGIPAGEEAKVFDKFYRVAKGGVGAGLGLTICRGIVKAHGGRIWVAARDGGGAAFHFTLPLEGDAPKLEPSEPTQPGLSARGGTA